LTWLLNIL
jgi:hypothetical protein